jgi:hypothetical protein
MLVGTPSMLSAPARIVFVTEIPKRQFNPVQQTLGPFKRARRQTKKMASQQAKFLRATAAFHQ